MQPEDQLIKDCLQFDPKAQKQLYSKYSAKLLGVCCRYIQDRSAAEDVLQEVFVKIFRNLEQYSGSGSFEGWLKRKYSNFSFEKKSQVYVQ
jgi:DNA-directed RNA polymerase specialized sigma24 family protein